MTGWNTTSVLVFCVYIVELCSLVKVLCIVLWCSIVDVCYSCGSVLHCVTVSGRCIALCYSGRPVFYNVLHCVTVVCYTVLKWQTGV